MGHRAWRARALAVLVLCGSASVRAQTLPPVPELRLSWPLKPLAFSYVQSEITGYANGPLQLFRAESLWLRLPAIRLLTFTSAERAFELDCSHGCQPIVARSVGVEARVLLPRFSPAVVEPHVFFRQAGLRTPVSARTSGQWQAGFGGAF